MSEAVGSSTFYLILLVSIVALMEVGAEFALGLAAREPSFRASAKFIVGVLLYAAIGVLYGYSLRHGSITIANGFWQIFSIVSISAVGIWYFGDRPTLGQIVGLLVVIIGSMLMFSGSPEFAQGLPKWAEELRW